MLFLTLSRALELVHIIFVRVLNIRLTKRNDMRSTNDLDDLYLLWSFTVPRGPLLAQIKVCTLGSTCMPQAVAGYF